MPLDIWAVAEASEQTRSDAHLKRRCGSTWQRQTVMVCVQCMHLEVYFGNVVRLVVGHIQHSVEQLRPYGFARDLHARCGIEPILHTRQVPAGYATPTHQPMRRMHAHMPTHRSFQRSTTTATVHTRMRACRWHLKLSAIDEK